MLLELAFYLGFQIQIYLGDQALSLWRGSTDSKTLIYQRTNHSGPGVESWDPVPLEMDAGPEGVWFTEESLGRDCV